ncbi:MAG: polymer-forming cytoskeletal protein [Anaerolineae bacterium]|nr:polymer-forming cytoskeletal protein [Anaerolineae bacterium]
MSFFSNRRQSDNNADKQAPKPIPQHPVGFETVLGAGSSMEGSFSTKGNVRLDGDFTGTLDIEGNVLVGETAKITADIEARNISIAGAVRGNINGNKVQLLRTGRIWGDIKANALTTEEGAFIDGKITMKNHEAHDPTKTALEQETSEIRQVSAVEDVEGDAEEAIEDDNFDDSPATEHIRPLPTEHIRPLPDAVVDNPDDDTIVDRGTLVDDSIFESDDGEDDD